MAKGIICSTEEREELMESHASDKTVGINTENNYKHHQESKRTSARLEFLLCLSCLPVNQRILQVCGAREHLAANL